MQLRSSRPLNKPKISRQGTNSDGNLRLLIKMKLPYSHLHALGDYVFAARGGTIYSFNVSTGSHISTWKHPDVEKQAAIAAEAQSLVPVAEVNEDVDMVVAAPASDEPPAKRQRRDANGDEKETDEAGAGAENAQSQGQGGKKKGKKAKGRPVSQRAPQADRALIVLITSTDDGKHLVAVSGHDKIIWVFEHDGEGGFKELSQRYAHNSKINERLHSAHNYYRKMPKRPIDLVIGPDNIIVTADKFGDVYSLPLLFDPSDTAKAPSVPSLSVPKVAKPAATTLTVHSKRNRQSLEAQLRMYEERERNGGAAATPRAEEPNFELSLLLGHVSMLTALTLGKSDGRNYILTADRDEHVRVSRYIPQAHVIEGFCLGHQEFIAAMVIPAGRPDVLVSGGGDTDLFVWDWKKGERLSTVSVLSLAQVVAPETLKVAVSSLTTLAWPTEEGSLSYVLAICEG